METKVIFHDVGRTSREDSISCLVMVWNAYRGGCVPRGLHGTEYQTLGVTLNLCTMRLYNLGERDLVYTQLHIKNCSYDRPIQNKALHTEQKHPNAISRRFTTNVIFSAPHQTWCPSYDAMSVRGEPRKDYWPPIVETRCCWRCDVGGAAGDSMPVVGFTCSETHLLLAAAHDVERANTPGRSCLPYYCPPSRRSWAATVCVATHWTARAMTTPSHLLL